MKFEWNEEKNEENIKKHGIDFRVAQYAFRDTKRVIAQDIEHSVKEKKILPFW